ncbi:AAA family ATPase [Deferribacter autotrophicus]|uniref:AAA family ATPase n=1 Tax=Deferribacter autotrophicus TaxID=500465 RepID=A0A5A8F2V6_9BACT|nr:ATP-binding protein [Deferribacter autotrophicus]KAA0258327.1 AAA family ATPase [Deferribacter autotrophicus]
MKIKKLPIGQSSFENLIKNNCIYIDKTEKIYQLITTGQFYFLSRPRRFGKSLLVSTLKNIFLGNKELFKGLWIYESDYEWKKHPVITIDFNEILLDTSPKLLQGLAKTLDKIANYYEIKLCEVEYKYKFEELIVKLKGKYEHDVVVLIDEYDKPIITHLGVGEERLKIAKENRDILKSFYGTLKGENVIKNLRFVLLTGVSKFSKAGVFSELNNLNDISMHSKYADLLGVTEDELRLHFDDYLQETADELGIENEKLISKIIDYYNGYRFSEKNLKVINPYSLLCLFDNRMFRNYWFESGTPTFLVNLLKQEDFYLPRVENLIVKESIFSTYELEDLDPTALLFQTGYLTIKDYYIDTNEYVLSYPNKEVKYSFLEILYKSYTNDIDNDNRFLELGRALRSGNIDKFIELAKLIFSRIAYSVGSKLNEANFHTLFYLMVSAGGAPAEMEILSCDGRIDMVVSWKDKIFIMEFKCDQSAEKALEQIKEKNYSSRFRVQGSKLYLIGINFDTNIRNISDWKSEVIG